jgi:hypothetical protein
MDLPWLADEGGENIEGRYWFRLDGLVTYLKKERWRAEGSKEFRRVDVTKAIRAMGGDIGVLRIGEKPHKLWWIPGGAIEVDPPQEGAEIKPDPI